MPLLPEKRLPLLICELCPAPLPQMSQLSFWPADGIVRTSGFRALCAAGLFSPFPQRERAGHPLFLHTFPSFCDVYTTISLKKSKIRVLLKFEACLPTG